MPTERCYFENSQTEHDGFRRLVAAYLAAGLDTRVGLDEVFAQAHSTLKAQEEYIRQHTWHGRDDSGSSQ